MAIRLKKSLFIGLGGTGAEAVLHTKKRFLDAYGEIPSMIGFLVIDTDGGVLNKKIYEADGSIVSLENYEHLHLNCNGAVSIYQNNPNSFLWYPQINSSTLSALNGLGAGQIRSNGRYIALYNKVVLKNAIQNALDRISSPIPTESKYLISEGSTKTHVNVPYSVSGGTGSGTFIDVSNILRNILGNSVDIVPYIVMPDVFNSMATGPSMRNTKPNAYGAMLELDYLMHLTPQSSPLTTEFGDAQVHYNKPYDFAVVINNSTAEGTTYPHIKDIAELIGLGMYVGASEISANVTQPFDNVRALLTTDALDIHSKKAWACGMGISELVYDSKKVAYLYLDLLVRQLIKKLTNSNSTDVDKVNEFIDSPEVLIRENDNKDDVLDSLLDASPNYIFSASRYQDAEMERDEFVRRNTDDNIIREISSNYDEKLRTVKFQLNKFIKGILNSEGGVANSIHFLTVLKDNLQYFKGMMIEEKKELESNHFNYKVALEDWKPSTVDNLFGRKKEDERSSFESTVRNEVINFREILRREWAIRFFDAFATHVNEQKTQFELLRNKLENIANKSYNSALRNQNSAKSVEKTFVIELHSDDLIKASIKEDAINILDFLSKLKTEDKLVDFLGFNEENIEKRLIRYCGELGLITTILNRGIEDKLNDIPEDKLEHLLETLYIKSSPLWSYNFRGQKVDHQELHKFFLLGVPRSEGSIMNQKLKLFEKPGVEQVALASTNIKDRIIIYRFEAAVPIYAVNSMPDYEKAYNNSTQSHHIDSNWKTRMDREGYTLYPVRKQDNSIKSWTLGFVFNFIKFEKETKKYLVKSTKHGSPLKNYWKDLGSYRDQAFSEFKLLKIYEEIEDLISEKENQIGKTSFYGTINDVRSEGKYLLEYSQIDFTHEDIKNPKYQSIEQLLCDEIDFVTKELYSLN
jgi:hypothetical protein